MGTRLEQEETEETKKKFNREICENANGAMGNPGFFLYFASANGHNSSNYHHYE